MSCVFKGVLTISLLFAFSVDISKGYQPFLQFPVVPLVPYANQVQLPRSSLIQPHPIDAPLEITTDSDSSNSNTVRFIVHKEFELQPDGEYKDVSGETKKIIIPNRNREVESVENSSERETRRIKPANSISTKSPFKVVLPNHFFPSAGSVIDTENFPEEILKQNDAFTNSHSSGYSKEESEEDPSSYESSEEVVDDRPSGYVYGKPNTKKDLQRDFFRRPSDVDTDNEKDGSFDSDKIKPKAPKATTKPKTKTKTTIRPSDINVELLHTLSEQFLLENGKLTQLNASDFTLVDNSKEKYDGGYNNNNNRSKIEESAESSEESEEYPATASNTENQSYNLKVQNKIHVDEDRESGYQDVVQSIVQRQIALLQQEQQQRQQRESEQQKVQSQPNYAPKQVIPLPIQLQLPLPTQNPIRQQTSFKNQNLNVIPLQLPLSSKNPIRQQISFQNQNQNQNQNLPKTYPTTSQQNSIQNSNLQTHYQNLMRQKLNLIRQIQSQSQQQLSTSANNFNSSANYDSRVFKTPSPSLGYGSPSPSQQQQAEADELSVFLFDAPRFSSLNSQTPTLSSRLQTYSEFPASYTRRPLTHEPQVSLTTRRPYTNQFSSYTTSPLANEIPSGGGGGGYTANPVKLQRQPSQKSHYDRTLYQNNGNTISTVPTKSSRTLANNQDNNQWHPVTSRSILSTSPVPEKVRQINSLSKNKGKTSAELKIAPNFKSSSSSKNRTLLKNGSVHPVSIQDIIESQKEDSGSGSKEEGMNSNQSSELNNPNENGSNRPLFSLIDELTGVIEKHKSAATSSEEGFPQNSLKMMNSNSEILFSTQTPPQLSKLRNIEPQTSNLPQPQTNSNTNTNINQFSNINVAPSQIQSQSQSQNQPRPIPPFAGLSANLINNATSTNQITTQLPISSTNSPINNENQGNNEKLYYYTNDNRGRTPNVEYANGLVKTLMAVPPYTNPNNHFQSQRTKPRSPFHAFLNSLHVLHEKNKNRHSHVHELLKNTLNHLKKNKNSSPEVLAHNDKQGNKLVPSVYDAVPVFKVEPIPVRQIPFPIPADRRPKLLVTPINSEVELLDPANTNRGTQQRPLHFQKLRFPSVAESPRQTNRNPKEYLGDKYARLGENLFYRVHHIFKQFVPPILHVGPDEPPK